MLGNHAVNPPVVLAPMAGITNVAFRRLCREQGGGLYVCEMITTRALVERNPKTLQDDRVRAGRAARAACSSTASTRTITAAAVRMVGRREPGRPHRPELRLPGAQGDPQGRRLGAAVAAPAVRPRSSRPAVDAAAPAGIPVTIKMRKGIDDDHLTYVEAGLIAQEAGVAAVALHARTAAQRYSGEADWEAIATLKQALDVPVLGNGDIWEADDALRMVARDRLRRRRGRPRLPRPAVAVRRPGGRVRRAGPSGCCPTLGEVAQVMRRHAELLVEWLGTPSATAVTDFRKHVAWYLKGFPVGSRAAPRAGDGLVAGRTGRPARQARPGRRRSRSRPGPAARAAPTPRARSSCPTAGSTAATTTPSPRAPRLDDSGG